MKQVIRIMNHWVRKSQILCVSVLMILPANHRMAVLLVYNLPNGDFVSYVEEQQT